MGTHIDGLPGRVEAVAIKQLLLNRNARPERRRRNRFVDGLGQANVALDVRQRLELRRKVLELSQAALRRLNRHAQQRSCAISLMFWSHAF